MRTRRQASYLGRVTRSWGQGEDGLSLCKGLTALPTAAHMLCGLSLWGQLGQCHLTQIWSFIEQLPLPLHMHFEIGWHWQTDAPGSRPGPRATVASCPVSTLRSSWVGLPPSPNASGCFCRLSCPFGSAPGVSPSGSPSLPGCCKSSWPWPPAHGADPDFNRGPCISEGDGVRASGPQRLPRS